MKEKQKHIITAALPYANGQLHFGHLAGAYLPADIYVRYKRLKNEDVIFISGSDEHGAAIEVSAIKEKTTPQVIIDKYHSLNKQIFENLGINFDIYSRTSNDSHHEFAKEFFLNLFQKENVLKENESFQFYSEKHKKFLADRFVKGTCSFCNYEKASGDHCENCDKFLNCFELENPKSVFDPEDKLAVKKTKNLAFRLSFYKEELQKWTKSHPHWRKSVKSYCKDTIKNGLLDRDITRDLNWGIKVPSSLWEDKVLYVWFEAPIAYISFTKELLPDTWEDYWKDPNTKLVHFIGKDNISFHSIFFPAMLMAHSDYVLPTDIPANEFLNVVNNNILLKSIPPEKLIPEKISKSRGNINILFDKIYNVCDPDTIRYYLTTIMPETSDSNFNETTLVEKHNADLVGKLGNFVNRTVAFYNNNKDKFPNEWQTARNGLTDFTVLDLKLKIQEIEKFLENYNFKLALIEVMSCVDIANKFFQDSEPWQTIKTDRELCISDIDFCLNLCYWLAILISPFLPFTANKIIDLLGLNQECLKWECLFGMGVTLSFVKEPKKIFDHKLSITPEKWASNKNILKIEMK
jgi:methionyl-tRNA synthetase